MKTDKMQRRAAGHSLDVVVMLEVRAELRARGWNHDWPPPPAEALLPGRWPRSRDCGYPEKLPVRLPAGLVLREAIGGLRDWRDRWPDALPTRAFREHHEDQTLAEYEELAAKVERREAVP